MLGRGGQRYGNNRGLHRRPQGNQPQRGQRAEVYAARAKAYDREGSRAEAIADLT
jgi:hypothetical protein